MYFQHSNQIWSDFPELAVGVLFVDGISNDVSAADRLIPYYRTAQARLALTPEGEFPEIQAWRRAFSRMGLKPTRYRCASEALLRRLRKESSLPDIHPLINICNAVSVASAIPIAVFDVPKIAQGIEVRHATGDETYLTFAGATEHPEAGEVVFADEAGQAHARRWTNRQSAYSAAGAATATALIVAEAMHDSAPADVRDLTSALADEFDALWSVKPERAELSHSAPRFEFRPSGVNR